MQKKILGCAVNSDLSGRCYCYSHGTLDTVRIIKTKALPELNWFLQRDIFCFRRFPYFLIFCSHAYVFARKKYFLFLTFSILRLMAAAKIRLQFLTGGEIGPGYLKLCHLVYRIIGFIKFEALTILLFDPVFLCHSAWQIENTLYLKKCLKGIQYLFCLSLRAYCFYSSSLCWSQETPNQLSPSSSSPECSPINLMMMMIRDIPYAAL